MMPRPNPGVKSFLPMQLAPYGPVGELFVVDVYVVAARVLPQLQTQRAGYRGASAGGSALGWLEGYNHGAGLVAQAQVDVGRQVDELYVLDPERVAHLRS